MYDYGHDITGKDKTIEFGYLLDYSFTKIFHIKGEIGGYIFFDDRDNNIPKLFLKKLNDYHNNCNNGVYCLFFPTQNAKNIRI